MTTTEGTTAAPPTAEEPQKTVHFVGYDYRKKKGTAPEYAREPFLSFFMTHQAFISIFSTTSRCTHAGGIRRPEFQSCTVR